MTDTQSYRDACAKAQIAKDRLAASADEAKARIAPARLKQDVVGKIKASACSMLSNTKAKAREHSVATSAAGGAFLLFLARRPLWALLRRSYVRVRTAYSRDTETDNG